MTASARPCIVMGPLEQLLAQLQRPTATQTTYRLETTGRTARMHIYGLIGGWFGDVRAEEVMPALRDLAADTIEVYVNSPGGDAFDGIAIANALREHPARVEVHVDGLAASAASVLLTAADEVIMGSGSQVMIHDAASVGVGTAAQLRAEADVLDQLSAGVAELYAAKAGGTPAAWRELMLAETWYSADEAVAAGLADRIATGASKKQTAARMATFDLSAFTYAGRASAPAPAVLRPAALATTERNNTMNRAQLEAALAAGTITQEQFDNAIAALDAIEAADPPADDAATAGQQPAEGAEPAPAASAGQQPADPDAAARQLELRAGPQMQAREPRPHATTQARMQDPREFDRHMAAVGNDLRGGDPRQRVWMALSDIVQGDDAGEAFVNRPDWLGETWRASDESRDWIDAIGAPEQLNATRSEGFNWGTVELDEDDEPTGNIVDPAGPEVDEYPDDLTELPSNDIATFRQEFAAYDIAGAWRIQRRYVDFGSEAFWRSFRTAAVKSFRRRSNAGVRTRILTAAPDSATVGLGADVAVTASGVLKQLRADIRAVPGAHANRVFLGQFIYDLIEDLPSDSLPLWLKNAKVGAGPDEGKAEVDQLFIRLDSSLAAKQSVVFDSRGIGYAERSPFWIDALNVPNGGVHVGVHSYGELRITDERVVRSRTYA